MLMMIAKPTTTLTFAQRNHTYFFIADLTFVVFFNILFTDFIIIIHKIIFSYTIYK